MEKTIIYPRKCQIVLCKSFFLKFFYECEVWPLLLWCPIYDQVCAVIFEMSPIYNRVCAVTFEMSRLWLSLCCYFWGVPYLCCCFTGSVWLWSGQWWWMGGGGTRREPIGIWGTNWLIADRLIAYGSHMLLAVVYQFLNSSYVKRWSEKHWQFYYRDIKN